MTKKYNIDWLLRIVRRAHATGEPCLMCTRVRKFERQLTCFSDQPGPKCHGWTMLPTVECILNMTI